jgi:8-oxo-dGTP pyrophosphatase MutT (NUDIX family)
VIVRRKLGELLLCHVTHNSHWDLPKGRPDPGETAWITALRELKEETGLVILSEQLNYIGRLDYTKHKQLELFSLLEFIDPDLKELTCESTFEHNGHDYPEVDDYKWVARADIKAH